MFLFRPFGSGGSSAKLCSVLLTLIHGEVIRREYDEGRIGGLAKGGSILYAVERLACCFELRNSGMKVGVATQMKFRVLPFRVKI
jgi:hypothetical protein